MVNNTFPHLHRLTSFYLSLVLNNFIMASLSVVFFMILIIDLLSSLGMGLEFSFPFEHFHSLFLQIFAPYCTSGTLFFCVLSLPVSFI